VQGQSDDDEGQKFNQSREDFDTMVVQNKTIQI
jgi:hypothetical protein